MRLRASVRKYPKVLSRLEWLRTFTVTDTRFLALRLRLTTTIFRPWEEQQLKTEETPREPCQTDGICIERRKPDEALMTVNDKGSSWRRSSGPVGLQAGV